MACIFYNMPYVFFHALKRMIFFACFYAKTGLHDDF